MKGERLLGGFRFRFLNWCDTISCLCVEPLVPLPYDCCTRSAYDRSFLDASVPTTLAAITNEATRTLLSASY